MMSEIRENTVQKTLCMPLWGQLLAAAVVLLFVLTDAGLHDVHDGRQNAGFFTCINGGFWLLVPGLNPESPKALRWNSTM